MVNQIESFKPEMAPIDASSAFRSEYINSIMPNDAVSVPVAPERPPVIDAGSWDQVTQWIEGGHQVNFSTAGDGQVADYILGSDGKLVANPAKTSPSPDGSITIQVESNQGAEMAAKAAQQLKVAAIEQQIYYWQMANPGSKDIPHFLKASLASAQNTTPDVPPPTPSDRPAPQPQQQPSDAPAPPQNTGGGGGGGGGGGQRIGRAGIGDAPGGEGYRRGSFEPNGPIDRSAIPPKVAGDLPIKGEPSCTVDQIQEFLTKMGSPAAKEQGFSQALYDACTQRGIDPAVAVGFFLQESTCGRYGRGHENMSMGNIKGRAPESGGTDGTFRRYGSWAEGARDWARLIDENYVGKRGLESLSQVISVYAPSSDGNNERGYVATVKGVVENFKNQNRTVTA